MRRANDGRNGGCSRAEPRTRLSTASPERASDASSSAPRELEMGHVRRRDRARELQAVHVVAHAIEQELAASQENRYEVDLHFVDETRVEVLLRRLGAAGERDVA